MREFIGSHQKLSTLLAKSRDWAMVGWHAMRSLSDKITFEMLVVLTA